MKKVILFSLLGILCTKFGHAQINFTPHIGLSSITPDDNQGTSITNYSTNLTHVLGVSLGYKSAFIEYSTYPNRYEYTGMRTIQGITDIYSVLTSGTTHNFKLGLKHSFQNFDLKYSIGSGSWNDERVYVFNLNNDSNFHDWDIECQQLTLDLGVDIQFYKDFKFYFEIGGQFLLSNNQLQSNTLSLAMSTGIRYDIKINNKQSISDFLNKIW